MKISLIVFVVLFFITSVALLYLKGFESKSELEKHKGFAALTGLLFLCTVFSLMEVIIIAIIKYVR